MTLREEFLRIKTYEEYERNKDKYKSLEIPKDKELLGHWGKLLEECGVKFNCPDAKKGIHRDYFFKEDSDSKKVKRN